MSKATAKATPRPRKMIVGYPRLLQLLPGRTRQAIWDAIRDGKFPSPVRLSRNTVAWFEDEIAHYLDNLPRVSYGRNTARADKRSSTPAKGP